MLSRAFAVCYSGTDNTIKIWDIRNLKCILTSTSPRDGAATGRGLLTSFSTALFDPHRRKLVCASTDLHVWRELDNDAGMGIGVAHTAPVVNVMSSHAAPHRVRVCVCVCVCVWV